MTQYAHQYSLYKVLNNFKYYGHLAGETKAEKLREFARLSQIELEMLQEKHIKEIAHFHAVREDWFKEIQ